MNERLQELQQQIREQWGNWAVVVDLATEAIGQLDDDDDPRLIADLHVTLGTSLAIATDRAWTEEIFERILQAYGTALELYEAANDSSEALQTLQKIGVAYFVAAQQILGDAPGRLASAIRVYEDLLSAAPPTLDPQLRTSWEQQLDRMHEMAIELWETALPQLDREQYSREWAQAHLALGGLYRFRRGGDLAENLDRAAVSLDHALEVLSFEAAPEAWLHAHYHRGQTYLFRRGGDRNENFARALESLQIAVQHLTPERDPRFWSMLMTQIGQVQLHRTEIDAAIASIEQALTVDQTFWAPQTWANTQLLLAGLRLGMTADENTLRHDPPEPWSHDGIADPFDMSGNLLKQSEILAENVDMRRVFEEHVVAFTKGSAPAINDEWHVPPMVDESVVHLLRHFDKSVTAASLWLRNPAEREELESQRAQIYGFMLEQAVGRWNAAARTRALLEKATRGEEPFVLMLREFGMRGYRFQGVALTFGHMAESLGVGHMAERVAPLALVWIANPTDAGRPYTAEGYRVESGAEWQSDVRKLIAAASFIVMDNGAMTEGVRYEMTALQEMGRLDDTLFFEPGTAAEFLRVPVRGLTDEDLDRMRERARPRAVDPGALPAAACRWLDGSQRAAYERKLRSLLPWVGTLPAPRSAVAADLILDALAYVISAAVLLEHREVLPSLLAMVSRTIGSYPDNDLHEAQALAGMYAEMAEALKAQN